MTGELHCTNREMMVATVNGKKQKPDRKKQLLITQTDQ